jgi:hypothetical protein
MVATMIAAAVVGATTGFAYYATVFVVNFALSTIVTRIFSDNPEQQQDMGVRQQVPPSAVNAVPIVYGEAYMGGTFVDAVLSIDQKTMYYVLAVSSISPNGQFTFDTTDMYYGDRLMTFDGADQTKVISLTDEASPPNVDTKINGNLFIYLYSSNEAGTITPLNGAPAPSTVMGGVDIAAGLRWTGTRQMNGLGFAIVKLIYNRDAETTQLSPITFKVAHYLNGAGSAKPGDVWYDYITNKNYGGAVGWLPNGSFSSAFVDTASVATLNAYSDQTITFTNSGGSPSTQARYRINGVLDAGESVLSNIDRIMSACDSWMTYNAALGQWSVVVNKAETAAYAFTDNNIIGDIRVSATDITSSINQVEARFPFKENRDQANFINIKTPIILLYPNEPVNKYSVTYDLVNDSVQASYLANRLLEQAREDLIVSFNTTYFGIQVDAGDVVSVTNSNYGWTAKLFRVVKVNEASLGDGSLGARLELNEYNAQVYDDQTINQFAPVPNSGLPNVGFFSALTAPTVAGFPTVAFPYFNVTVTVPTTGRVTFLELFYTTTATPAATDWKLLLTATSANSEPFASSSSFVFSNQSLPTGTYYFGYIVGNEISQSIISPLSASFAWNPTGQIGPVGDTGPRNAQVYYFFNTPQSTAPTSPTTAQVAYDFNTSTPTISASGWSSTFNPSTVGTTTANNKYWSIRVIFQEIFFGGPYTETISSVFTWQNMDGLVTFTNLSGAIGPSGSGATFIDGGSITANSLTVNKITSGTTATLNGGTFALGATGTVLNGFSGVGAFESNQSGKWGVMAFLEDAGATQAAALGACVFGNGAPALGVFSATSVSYNSFYTAFSGATNSVAGNGRYNRSIGTPNNMNLIPVNSSVLNNNDNAGYFAYFGPTASNRVTEAYIANTTTVSAGVFRRYDTSGSTLINETYLNNGSYSVQSTLGAIFSAGGYLPFTGVHDGLIEESDGLAVGDIVVDYQVETVLDPSNIVMLYKKSSVTNQKGVIGVCLQIFDVPPSDWNEYENTGEVDPITGAPLPNPQPIPNPMYYPIPAGQKVIYVNSLGEGTINVTGEGGDIEIGDLIVTSSTPGKGMKQSDDVVRSVTVAKSRQSVTFSSPTDVQTIACIYLGG